MSTNTPPAGRPEALYRLAERVAIEAAEFVRVSRPPGRVEVAATKSSPTDAVTEIDRATEDLIRAAIAAERPDDGFVGEEGEDLIGTSGVDWVVDPIDGTVNFVYGIGAYGVSIAARVDGAVVAGCVVNVATGETYGAVLGGGAWKTQAPAGGPTTPLTAPTPPSVALALVATGFSYRPEIRAAQAAAMTQLLPQVRDIRRIGSAALDLCGLAEGRCDAYVEQGLKPWDLAAGSLVAAEAGIVLEGLDGPPDERLVMAAHPLICREYFALVRACGF
ncbi:inositol monophosphatase family protein [Aeromicrobium sp. CF3.5]|uniref:inositol monophosphatase family protein n=1 Tax=Aeromicrobium sp. CF3.5 TaxID=3373078 RepID=UPI003EE801D9